MNLQLLKRMIFSKNNSRKIKFFCVGMNKTGTTSIEKAFINLNYKVGNQRVAEEIYDKSFTCDQSKEIVEYCKTAQVFQDLPFAKFDYLPLLDNAFPKSKFILTVRDSPEQWYNSLVKFHSKLFGNDVIYNLNKLKSVNYVSEGFIYRALLAMGGIVDDPYNKDSLINYYENHNRNVCKYFEGRMKDFLMINLSDVDAYDKFTKFIDVVDYNHSSFPWENKT